MIMDKAELIARLSEIYEHLNPAYDYDLEDVQLEVRQLVEAISKEQ
jgi:hypothetical protein